MSVKSPRADYAEEEVSGHLGLNPAKWDLELKKRVKIISSCMFYQVPC
jgi:hypothetical protein